MSLEGTSTSNHILTLRTLIQQGVFASQCLYFYFANFIKAFDTVPRDKIWECLQYLGVPLHLQQVVKAMCIITYAKVRINGDTHGEVMSNISVK